LKKTSFKKNEYNLESRQSRERDTEEKVCSEFPRCASATLALDLLQWKKLCSEARSLLAYNKAASVRIVRGVSNDTFEDKTEVFGCRGTPESLAMAT
jgi:hypothetical protein